MLIAALVIEVIGKAPPSRLYGETEMSRKTPSAISLKSTAIPSAEQKHFSVEPKKPKRKVRARRTERSTLVISVDNKRKVDQPRTNKSSFSQERQEKFLAAVVEYTATPTPNPDEILQALQLYGSEEIKRTLAQLSPQGRQELGKAFLVSIATSRFLNRIHQGREDANPASMKKVHGYRQWQESNGDQLLDLKASNIGVYNAPMPERSNLSDESTQLTAADVSDALGKIITENRASFEGKRGRPPFRFERIHELVDSGKTEFSLTELAELFDTSNPRKSAASIMSTLKDALEASNADVRLISDTTYRFEPNLRD